MLRAKASAFCHCLSRIVLMKRHNTTKCNGYKVYGEDGGQLPPKEVVGNPWFNVMF